MKPEEYAETHKPGFREAEANGGCPVYSWQRR